MNMFRFGLLLGWLLFFGMLIALCLLNSFFLPILASSWQPKAQPELRLAKKLAGQAWARTKHALRLKTHDFNEVPKYPSFFHECFNILKRWLWRLHDSSYLLEMQIRWGWQEGNLLNMFLFVWRFCSAYSPKIIKNTRFYLFFCEITNYTDLKNIFSTLS